LHKDTKREWKIENGKLKKLRISDDKKEQQKAERATKGRKGI
jgi:hypothetical protein